MKPLYFLLFTFLFWNRTISQTTKDNIKDNAKISDVKNVQYTLTGLAKSDLALQLPFSRILFFDVRYDTSYVSINWQKNTGLGIGAYIQNSKLNLTGGLANSLNEYFNHYFNNNLSVFGAELLCYIKKLSINPRGTITIYTDPVESINSIKFEIECYYKKGDTLFPAIRLDTSYTERIREIRSSFPEVIKDVMNPLIKKITLIDIKKIQERNRYSLQQIEERYKARFNIPILTATEYKRGIYKNFHEFINNAPSVVDFTIKKDKYLFSLYDSTGKLVAYKTFGFCDGSNYWLYTKDYCTPLIRVGNSFEYFFTLYILGSGPYYNTTIKKFLLALNMTNGEID
jgi:hypothetical protein